MPLDDKNAAVGEYAQRLFKEYYASCFWHLKPDLIVTDAILPIIVKGLRTHGGRKGALAAGKLQEKMVKGPSCP